MQETITFPVGSGRTELVFSDASYVPEASPDRLFVFDANTAAVFPALPAGSAVLAAGEGTKSWDGASAIMTRSEERRVGKEC